MGSLARRAVLVGVSVLICTSCANEPTRITGPSGRDAYTLRCHGMGRTLEKCYQKAGELCPNGYNLIDNSTNVVARYAPARTRSGIAFECR